MDLLIFTALGRRVPWGERVARCGRAAYVHRWADAFRCLSEPRPPAALFIDAGSADDDACAALESVRTRGLDAPAAVVFTTPDPELIQRAWPLAALGIRSIFAGRSFERDVDSLMFDDNAAVLAYLMRRFQIAERSIPARLLSQLADCPPARYEPVARLATRVEVGRARLFEEMAIAGLAPPQQWQYLFRLLPAVRRLQNGARAADAAVPAGLSDARALRRAIERRVGVTIGDLRSRHGWRWLVDRWIDRHHASAPDALPEIQTLGPRGAGVASIS